MFKNLYSIVSLFLTVVMLVTGTYIWTAIGLGFTLYVFARFLDVLGQKIPVIELMATLASLQWILGPFIEYRREFHHYRYQMYVDEPLYMSYIVPAVLAFWIGSNLIRRTDSLEVLRTRSRLIAVWYFRKISREVKRYYSSL